MYAHITMLQTYYKDAPYIMCYNVIAEVGLCNIQTQCGVLETVAYTDSYGSLDLDVGFTPVNVVKFWRLEKQKSLYYSKEYTRTSKINNYTILYDQDGTEKFGLIKYFLELQRITNTSEFFVIAVIDELCTAPFVRGSSDNPTSTNHSISATIIYSCCQYQAKVHPY